MTIARRIRRASLALLALSSMSLLQNAYAVGTPAGTTISNQATVSYSVGTVPQADIVSAAAEFVVDSRIDFTVTRLNAAAPINATPNAPDVVATFTVSNTGNSTQSYQLIASDPAGLTVFSNAETPALEGALVLTTAWDSNGNGVYDGGDQAGNTGDVAPGAAPTTVLVFVLADIPATAANGQFASIRLTVRAATAGSTGGALAAEDNNPDSPTLPAQVVWADADEDNSESVDNQFAIVSANLVVQKSVEVIDDPFNGAVNPKAIPGATVEYTITVENNGAEPATAVTLSDPIPANTTYVPGSITVNTAAVGDAGRTVGSPVTSINLDPGAIAASATATVTFRVTINTTP